MNISAEKKSEPKTWDTFLYSGEKHLLLARLRHLAELIDYFVILESSYTFSGRERSVDYDFREKILKEYGSKVSWIVLEEFQEGTAWQREAFQRQFLTLGLHDLNIGDLVILSDLDEIPNAHFVRSLYKVKDKVFVIAKIDLFRYCPHYLSSEIWYGPIGFRYDGSQLDFQLLRMRAVRHWQEKDCIIIDDAGVHCSSFLSTHELKDKIRSFSHTELNTFPWNNSLFLFLLSKFGVSFDGKEVLKLTRRLDHTHFGNLCSRKHRADRIRVFAASKIARITECAFEKYVSKLSGPGQE